MNIKLYYIKEKKLKMNRFQRIEENNRIIYKYVNYESKTNLEKLNLQKQKNNKTKQLDNETQQKKNLINNLDKYGLEFIEDWGGGSRNKKLNKNTDITCKIININNLKKIIPNLSSKLKNDDFIYISLKTERGKSFIANIGTTHNRTKLFKYLGLGNELINKFKKVNEEIKYIKNSLNKNDNWENNIEEKNKIKKLLVDLIHKVFNKNENVKKLYEWLNQRESDLIYIGSKMFIPKKKKFTENIKVVKGNGIDNIIVGNYRLRVKCASRKVKDSWKISIEVIN